MRRKVPSPNSRSWRRPGSARPSRASGPLGLRRRRARRTVCARWPPPRPSTRRWPPSRPGPSTCSGTRRRAPATRSATTRSHASWSGSPSGGPYPSARRRCRRWKRCARCASTASHWSTRPGSATRSAIWASRTSAARGSRWWARRWPTSRTTRAWWSRAWSSTGSRVTSLTTPKRCSSAETGSGRRGPSARSRTSWDGRCSSRTRSCCGRSWRVRAVSPDIRGFGTLFETSPQA